MKKKINIAEILKDKPNGLRLYSPIFGYCTFCCVREDTNDICVKKHNGVKEFFNSKGLYYNTGEVMLFPSKSIRDWDKFSWKKGDVLVNENGDVHIIFEKFIDDAYTIFAGNHYYCKIDAKEYIYLRECDNIVTELFTLETEDTAKTYINTIEERLGGKLNRETLEIEKQTEFKDGDVLFVKCNDSAFIEIFEYSKNNGDLCDHASLDITNQILDISGKYIIRKDEITELRLATEEEKKQLLSAIAKKNKAWDAKKKQIVDLKPKWTPKSFDRVITRNDYDDIWIANIFSHMDSHGEYVTIGCVGGYTYCIPYNEETAKLIGTTNNVEG